MPIPPPYTLTRCPALAELPELPTVLQPWLVLFGGDQLGAFEAGRYRGDIGEI